MEDSELGVVPFVVGVSGGVGAADALSALDFPAGGAEAAEGGRRDVVVGEEEEVFGGV